ncbi:MipA/OmpV family protein [Altererythrobacter xixiisoli]|uniref:MipA/OmpV family protein n=1 Tax=Croceibacterium xixiisoli TaxID=1476466 RepID=A0A6I4TWB9_9SPHN|nr:MipA/OmpV family protein [Croceibacterium xixiisoli]MXO99421.1 MipA/OmpV family protein [Croceibacterium xixiisoli]
MPGPAAILRQATLAGAALLACGATSAQAQDSDRVTLGVGVIAAPGYQGSDDYRVLPAPIIDVQIGRFFAGMNNGVGVHVIDTPDLKTGASVTFVRGYRRGDLPDGLDTLADAAGARLFASARLAGISAGISATRSLGGTAGTVADLSLSYPIRSGERLMLIPSVSTSWASDKAMDRYFGITAAEAQASGLDEFHTSAGFRDMTASMTANYRLSGRLSLVGMAGMTQLFDKAADSPMVKHRWRPMGLVGVTHRF